MLHQFASGSKNAKTSFLKRHNSVGGRVEAGGGGGGDEETEETEEEGEVRWAAKLTAARVGVARPS